jgi:hypothetical protein
MVMTHGKINFNGSAFCIVTQIATLEFKGCQGVIW